MSSNYETMAEALAARQAAAAAHRAPDPAKFHAVPANMTPAELGKAPAPYPEPDDARASMPKKWRDKMDAELGRKVAGPEAQAWHEAYAEKLKNPPPAPAPEEAKP